MNGRDTKEAHFYTEDGTEYMEMSSFLYVSKSNVKSLDTGQLSKVTLQKNGHAKWFTIPQEAAGKTMNVELPSGVHSRCMMRMEYASILALLVIITK